MKIFGKAVVATVLVLCTAGVNAEDRNISFDTNGDAVSPPDRAMGSLQNKVIRYSAGDSIPLGYPGMTTRAPVEVVQGDMTAAQGVPHEAGGAIPAGFAPEMAQGRFQAVTTAAGYSSASFIPLAAALGDSVTTHIGISHAGLAEANGLINVSPAGLLGLFVVKAGIVYYFEQQEPAIRKSGLKATAGVWSAFTMNNILLIAGASNPLGLVGGALFGAYMYHREGIALEKESLTTTEP